jgi:hypothetical protein
LTPLLEGNSDDKRLQERVSGQFGWGGNVLYNIFASIFRSEREAKSLIGHFLLPGPIWGEIWREGMMGCLSFYYFDKITLNFVPGHLVCAYVGFVARLFET